MHRIDSLLRQEIGLDAASMGPSLIERTVRLRMKSLGIKTIEDYRRRLDEIPAEWEELVEAVVVKETWFFRDRDPFTAFIRLVLDEWLPLRPMSALRVLSVPCSSGEEPYSLAIALLDAGIPKEQFLIDAVDISARALARAKRGIYGKNSFRGKDLVFRDRHFQHTQDGYMLHPHVRNLVQFHRDNLLSDDFLVGRACYDFIFCRNLLIYFDRATQAKALEKIHRILMPQGVLFVGPAELPLVIDNGFTSANVSMAFACRKCDPEAVQIDRRATAGKSVRPLPLPNATLPIAVTRKPASPDSEVKQAAMAHATVAPAADLETARRLADAGKLKQAAATCETYLRQRGPSAQAYYLLGLLRDAGGDPAAIDYYRKALYLEPNHHETLLQMALLLQKNGDTAKARAFKRRAQRVQEKV
jgi:chemotaxis protein methyltransferase WspC